MNRTYILYKKLIINKYNIISFLSAMLLIGVWHIIALIVGKEIILPSPLSVLRAMLSIVTHPSFFYILLNTFIRILLAFSITLVLSLILGVASGINNVIYAILRPIVNVLKSILTVSIILIILIITGKEFAPTIVSIIIVFPVLYSNIYHGIKKTDRKLIQMADTYRVNKKRIIKDIYLPSINSYISAGLNSSLGLSFKVTIATELIGMTNNSIGAAIYWEKINLNTPSVFAWTLIIILLSAVFDNVLGVIIARMNNRIGGKI